MAHWMRGVMPCERPPIEAVRWSLGSSRTSWADVQKFVEESGVDVVQLHGSENLAYARKPAQVPHARVLHAEPSENIDAAAADLAATYAQVASAKCCLVLVGRAAGRARCPEG